MFILSACVVVLGNVSATVPEPEWEDAAPLPYAVYLAATVQDDDYHLYIIGGREGMGAPSYDNVTLYDLETEEVSQLAHVPVGVNGASAAMGEDGRIYVFGGRNLTLPNLYQYEVQIYDPTTDEWSIGAGMPMPCTISEAVAMPNGLIYVISGINETYDLNLPIGKVQIYDPAADSWSTGADMSEPRYSGAALTLTEDIIIYIGGSNPDTGYTYNSITLYNIKEDQWWGSMNPFPEQFAGGDALMGPDGMIYLIGGGRGNNAYSTNGVTTNTSICMDPYHSSFVSMPIMDLDRKYHSVGFDEEGNIFAIGGYSWSEPHPYTTAKAEKIKVMDLQMQIFPQERDIFTGEQVLVKADFNFAFAPWEDLAARVEVINADGDAVYVSNAVAYVGEGNAGHYYLDVPEVLPSGDYEVRFSLLHPADYTWNDLGFDGFSIDLSLTNAGSVQELLDEQNGTLNDLQGANNALADDLADANEKIDSLATNLMIVMVLAIVAIIVAAVAVVLLLRKKA